MSEQIKLLIITNHYCFRERKFFFFFSYLFLSTGTREAYLMNVEIKGGRETGENNRRDTIDHFARDKTESIARAYLEF